MNDNQPMLRWADDPLELVAQDFRRAFPLPVSGEFTELLQAIDEADANRGESGCSNISRNG